MPYPGRHDRVAAGYGQPGQRVSQSPAFASRILQDFLQHRTAVDETGCVGEPRADRPVRIGVGWPGRLSQSREKGVKAGPGVARAEQPVPGRQQVGACCTQCFLLVAENVQGEASVQLRIVDAPAFELSVLIVLD